MLITPKYECFDVYRALPGQATLIVPMIAAHGDPEACLVWPFKIRKNGGGYGVVRHSGEDWRVHRLAYKIVHGRIPRDKDVMHSCDNPPCFNPNHLSLGAENCNDRHRKGRTKPPNHSKLGETQWKAKLDAARVLEIRRLYSGGSTQVALAAQFGVAQPHISHIILRKSWRHI